MSFSNAENWVRFFMIHPVFICFDKMHERDRQTDGHRMTA